MGSCLYMELVLWPLTIRSMLIKKHWFSILRLEKVCQLFSADKNCVPSNTSILTGANAYFNLLEYYKLRFRRDGSKLFMLSCDSKELLMSMGAEQKPEIVKAFGLSTALECSVNKAH